MAAREELVERMSQSKMLDVARIICRGQLRGPGCVMDDEPDRPLCDHENCDMFRLAEKVAAAILPNIEAKARRQALEDAAKVVEAEGKGMITGIEDFSIAEIKAHGWAYRFHESNAFKRAAAAIRALIPKPEAAP